MPDPTWTNTANPERLTVGTCSLCGGPVTVPSIVYVGSTDTRPTCSNCGAVKREATHGDVVDMVKNDA